MNDSNFNLQKQAYKKILHKIIHCEYTPGQKIYQSKLVEDLNLGRTPVREALLQLRRENLVYTIPQSGTFVTRINLDSVINGRFVRENLEKKIMEEATILGTSLLFEQARDAISLQEKFIADKDFNRFFDEDETFHKSFYLATNRTQIWDWVQEINIQFRRFRWLRLRISELPWDILMEQHREILAAVDSQNTEKALLATEKHLHLVFDEEFAVIKKFPDYFENLPV